MPIRQVGGESLGAGDSDLRGGLVVGRASPFADKKQQHAVIQFDNGVLVASLFELLELAGIGTAGFEPATP